MNTSVRSLGFSFITIHWLSKERWIPSETSQALACISWSAFQNVRYSSTWFYHGDLNIQFKGPNSKKTGFAFFVIQEQQFVSCLYSVNTKSLSFYQIKNHNTVHCFCWWFRTLWCLAAIASNQLQQHLLRSWVREQKMETEASFHGFAAKLLAGSLARVGFGQSDVTAGKQRA